MREIIFRGKRMCDSKWVEGYYTKYNADYIIGISVIETEDFDYEVDPSTLGQYTNMTDKNGTKIFEGDILKFPYGSCYPVFWDSDYYAFGSCYYRDFDYLAKYNPNEIEVVGNIYDSPELLEE